MLEILKYKIYNICKTDSLNSFLKLMEKYNKSFR